MADAAPQGFAPSELRLLARGEARVLVSRLRAGWRILVLSLLALGALVVPALDLRLEPVALYCSRDDAACTVTSPSGEPRSLPFPSITRFTVRHPRKQQPELLAETAQGAVLLVQRWSRPRLDEHAAALNRLLRGDGSARWGFAYDRRGHALGEDLPIFGPIFLILCVVLVAQLGWRTRLDRRGRRVVCWRPPFGRTVRPVAGFREVTVGSMAEAYPGRLAAASGETRAVLEAHLRIALVDAGGAAWPISRWVTCPRYEVEARAAEVAAYLDLPVAQPQPLATVLAPAGPAGG
jgi:hypothetical protein